MANIVDRRLTDKNKSAENRNRFIKRYKEYIKRSMDKSIDKGSITDINGKRVSIPKGVINEPSLQPDYNTGQHDSVHPGNKKFIRGDKVRKPSSGSGQGSGSGSGNGGGGAEDEFSFVLTRDEFLDLFFSDMELPNFVKKSMKTTTKYIRQNAGYRKEGTPSQLVIKKTFENAIARRIASRSEDKDHKSPFLDDIDIRYRNHILIPKPDRHATMICLMDVSGSMTQADKTLAKKFYMLLHLFLSTVYKTIDLKFIRYKEDAALVDEETFFYSRETGGTNVSNALDYTNNVILEECVPTSNIYLAHVSDGDFFDTDDYDKSIDTMKNKIMPKVQYAAYINLTTHGRPQRAYDILHAFDSIGEERLQSRYVSEAREIKHVLGDLFKKRGA